MGRGGRDGSSGVTAPTTSTQRALRSRRKSAPPLLVPAAMPPPPPPSPTAPYAWPSPPRRLSGLRDLDRTGECDTTLLAAAKGGGGGPRDGGRGGLRRVLRRLGDSGEEPRMVDRDGCEVQQGRDGGGGGGEGKGEVNVVGATRGERAGAPRTAAGGQAQSDEKGKSAVKRRHHREPATTSTSCPAALDNAEHAHRPHHWKRTPPPARRVSSGELDARAQ